MTTAVIIFLIIGAALILFSHFLREDEINEISHIKTDELTNKDLLSQEDQAIKQRIRLIMEEEEANAIMSVSNKMNQISNEKIMAVNEFSEGLLAKIENNNEEVIFLYNMLKQKEDEMKHTLSKVDALKKDNEQLILKVSSLDSQLLEENKRGTIPTYPDQVMDEWKETDEAMAFHDIMDHEKVVSKSEEILRLHANHLSVMEISKQLSLGQGEVKLIIDLYGNGTKG